MVTMKLQTGLVVFWSLAEFADRLRLQAGWNVAGYGQFVPEPRANVSILRDALNEVFAGTRFLVRPLATRNGFAVVKEARGSDENTYSPVLTAKVFGDDSPLYSGDLSKSDAVNAAYHKHAGRVAAHQLSSALVRILYDQGGTRLRPSGSVYWMPGDRAEIWDKVVAGFEQAADGDGKSVGYTLRHDLDSDSIVAVRDAIVHEVTTEASRLSQEILRGDLGKKAIESRKREAWDLRRKVIDYEYLLGVGLKNLKDALDRVDQIDASAVLLLAADPFDMEAKEVAHAAA